MGNRIDYEGYSFTDEPEAEEQITDGNAYLSSAIPSDELPYDTMEATVKSKCLTHMLYAPADHDAYETVDGKLYLCRYSDDDLTQYVYGTAVYFYRDAVLFKKFYITFMKRTGKTVFKMSCVSAIGLLDTLDHNGDIYTGETVEDVLADIIGDTFTYTVEAELAEIPVYGWLPAAKRRANLHQLLFALGISVSAAADGNPHFTFMDAASSGNISDDRLFIDGEIEYPTPATGVDVTEHAFLALSSDQEKTLFDNTDGSGAVDGQKITFDGPYHDLQVTGTLSIDESGVNYAILSGTGTLTGKAYTHQRKIVSLRLSTSAKENIRKVEDRTLVSVANSENVAARVLSYYSAAKIISGDLKVGTERPGALVNFNDPFDAPTEAFLQSLDITFSRTLRAAATFIANYTPTGYGNYYNTFELLTGSGNWTSPVSGRIRVIMIGGAQGGWSGQKGADGTTDEAGEGGVAGEAGQGGYILNVTLEVTLGQVISFACGLGGLGGVYFRRGERSGRSGYRDHLGALTSADGLPSETGFLNLFSRLRYGYKGVAGLSGGKGSESAGVGDNIIYKEVVYTPGARGDSETISGTTAYGGFGGGPAAGKRRGRAGRKRLVWRQLRYVGYTGRRTATAAPERMLSMPMLQPFPASVAPADMAAEAEGRDTRTISL
jgi:hypothetical protein